jgi:hypothetical protein
MAVRLTLQLLSSFGVLAASSASAFAGDDVTDTEALVARIPAQDDAFTPAITHAAAHGAGYVVAIGGWNGAEHQTTLDINGEIQVFGPLRLVLRVANQFDVPRTGQSNQFDVARPAIGAAVQFLDESKHGVSSSAYFVYKAEGFTEAEGELEGQLAFGKQLGPLHATLNLAYGQDFDNVERDGEIAMALHVEPIHGLFAGIAGRYRDSLGSNGDKSTGILQDALAGATATYAVGNLGISATAGFAGVKTLTSGSMQGGAEAALAVGAVF